MAFVVGKLALGQISLRALRFYTVRVITIGIMLQTHLNFHVAVITRRTGQSLETLFKKSVLFRGGKGCQFFMLRRFTCMTNLFTVFGLGTREFLF